MRHAFRQTFSRGKISTNQPSAAKRPGRDNQAGGNEDDVLEHVLTLERRGVGRAGEQPPRQEVITLAFFGQLSHTEIATQLGLPCGTIKGRMRLGLQKLRANLDQAVA